MYRLGVGVALQRPEPSDNRVALQCPEVGAGSCWEEGSRSGQVTLWLNNVQLRLQHLELTITPAPGSTVTVKSHLQRLITVGHTFSSSSRRRYGDIRITNCNHYYPHVICTWYSYTDNDESNLFHQIIYLISNWLRKQQLQQILLQSTKQNIYHLLFTQTTYNLWSFEIFYWYIN